VQQILPQREEQRRTDVGWPVALQAPFLVVCLKVGYRRCQWLEVVRIEKTIPARASMAFDAPWRM
jgi:hypothetical protein